MELLTIIFIALGLAMDAFAVSVVTGSIYKKLRLSHALRMAFFFGAFQAVMPLIGSLAALSFKNAIEGFDHWVAFGLLALIGVKMIYESFRITGIEDRPDPASLAVVLVLAVATSIDALAVGITLSLITSYIIFACFFIGLVTLILSYIGCMLGQRIGHFFENKIEIAGGVILIAIGLKILLQHLLSATP